MQHKKSTPTKDKLAGAKSADRTDNKQALYTATLSNGQACGTCACFRIAPTKYGTNVFCGFTGEKLNREVIPCTFFDEACHV